MEVLYFMLWIDLYLSWKEVENRFTVPYVNAWWVEVILFPASRYGVTFSGHFALNICDL